MLPAEITPTPPLDLQEVDTPTLRGELSRALTLTAQGITYLAAVWAELERRGEDLSDLRSGLASYLPAIAAGTLAAEAVVQFAGQRNLLKRISALALDEQVRIAHGEPLPVIITDDSGDFTEKLLPARALTARQVLAVFDDHGRVRSPIEQRQIYSSAKPRGPRPRRVTRPEVEAALAVLPLDELKRLALAQGYTLTKACAEPECERAAAVKGLCQSHYQRSRTQGETPASTAS